jgi:hypothetical protein
LLVAPKLWKNTSLLTSGPSGLRIVCPPFINLSQGLEVELFGIFGENLTAITRIKIFKPWKSWKLQEVVCFTSWRRLERGFTSEKRTAAVRHGNALVGFQQNNHSWLIPRPNFFDHFLSWTVLSTSCYPEGDLFVASLYLHWLDSIPYTLVRTSPKWILCVYVGMLMKPNLRIICYWPRPMSHCKLRYLFREYPIDWLEYDIRQCGAPQWCERWFINPHNYSYLRTLW